MRGMIKLSIELAILISLVTISTLIVSGYEVASQYEIPKGNKSDNPSEVEWWEGIRTSGKNAASAMARKDKVFRKAFTDYSIKYHTHPPDDESKIFSNKELNELNAAIATSREKYIKTLRESAEKSFKAPIPDGRPYALYGMMPRYTEPARMNNIRGAVSARAEFLPDGTVGKVEILSRLGYGLDERAEQVIRGMIFLPARENGRFVTYWQKISIEFDLR